MTFLLIGFGACVVFVILFAVASCRLKRIIDSSNHKLD